jgi:hypothetical protein
LRIEEPDALSKINLAVLALLFAAASTGFAICMSVVHYSTWQFIPSSVFAQFQPASAMRTVPLAVALGIPSLVLAAITAFRRLPGVSPSQLWIAAALAAVPWIATPTVIIPIQARLAASGPVTEIVQELVWNDFLLRSMPPFIQSMILLAAVLQFLRRAKASA